MKTSHSDLAPIVPILRQGGMKTLLHVGCGSAPRSRLPEVFQSPDWKEIRLDIDVSAKPDIVASLTDMHLVQADSVDAVWSSHSVEHLEGFEVPLALTEFHRVLKPGGFALITLPDMEHVAHLIADGMADKVLYTSPAGPITPLDMIFGHQTSIASGKRHMAHRTGFTTEILYKRLIEASFADVRVMRGKNYDIWAAAVKLHPATL